MGLHLNIVLKPSLSSAIHCLHERYPFGLEEDEVDWDALDDEEGEFDDEDFEEEENEEISEENENEDEGEPSAKRSKKTD